MFNYLINFVEKTKEKIFGSYESCYTKQEYSGKAAMGLCDGYVGGTSATGYLSEQCVGCPHLWIDDVRDHL